MGTPSIHDTQIRVASYNVRNCLGLDRRRDPARVLGVISELNADIIALQESDARWGERRTSLPREQIETQTDYEPVELSPTDASLGWHGNAVLVRKNVTITSRDRLDLPGLEARGAALVETVRNGRALRVVATHLGLLRRHRRLQLREITAQLARREAMPTLIMGDFNEWSRNKGLEALEIDYEIHTPGRSFHAARPLAALDRIATNADLSLRDAGVHQRGDALKASDHLPVWADLEMAGG